MKNIFYLLFSLNLSIAACPEGFYEDSCGNCWMDYCYDYVSHQVFYDLDENQCNGATHIWVIPSENSSDPYFNNFCEGTCPDGFINDDCGHCWQSFCYTFFSPGLNGDPSHSVYYDLSEEECLEYGYGYYAPNHASNPQWNINCPVDCNDIINGDAVFDECGVCGGDGSTCVDEVDCADVIGGDAMVDDCGECLSGYCYDYVTHEVSFGACDGPTQMWVNPDSPQNPYWNASCLECGSGDYNGDLLVNVSDVVGLVSFILFESIPNSSDICSSDFNGDGNINIVDVVSIVDLILNN